MMNSDGMMMDWGWGGMASGGLMMILWFVLIIGLIVFLVRWISGTSDQNSNKDALDILQQRYARGEIDAAELEERSTKLRAGK